MNGRAVAGAFLRRDWSIAISYRLPFVINLVGMLVILFPLHQISKIVTPAHDPASDQLGKGYFSFAAVGVLVLVVAAAAVASFANEMREQQAIGTLEALLATPRSPSVIILGSALFEVVQSLTIAIVVVGVAVVAGAHLVADPVALALGVVDLLAIVAMFVAVGVAIGAFTLVFKRGGTAAGLLVAAFAILCGVWYPVQVLPTGMRWLAEAVPVTWGLTELRAAWLYGTVDWARFVAVLVGATVMVMVALALFRRAVDRVRRAGTLAQY